MCGKMLKLTSRSQAAGDTPEYLHIDPLAFFDTARLLRPSKICGNMILFLENVPRAYLDTASKQAERKREREREGEGEREETQSVPRKTNNRPVCSRKTQPLGFRVGMFPPIVPPSIIPFRTVSIRGNLPR